MIEPSDAERSELPDTTKQYINDLEQANARLNSFLNRPASKLITCPNCNRSFRVNLT